MNQLISFTCESSYFFIFLWFFWMVKLTLHEKFKLSMVTSKYVISLVHTLFCIFNCLAMIAYSGSDMGEDEPTYALTNTFMLRLSTSYFIYDTINVLLDFRFDRVDAFYLYHHIVSIFALRNNLIEQYKLYIFLFMEMSNIFLFVSYYKTNNLKKHQFDMRIFEKRIDEYVPSPTQTNMIQQLQKLKQQELLLCDNLFFWKVVQLDVHIVLRCFAVSAINLINIVKSPNMYALFQIILHPVQGIYVVGLYYTFILKNNLYENTYSIKSKDFKAYTKTNTDENTNTEENTDEIRYKTD